MTWVPGYAHPLIKNEAGKVYGTWRVESRAQNQSNGNASWHCACQCGCGEKRIIQGIRLRSSVPRCTRQGGKTPRKLFKR